MYTAKPTLRGVLDSNELSLLDGVGVVAFTAVAAATFGLWGVVAGGTVLAVATVTTGPAAFVAAQLWAVAFLPQGRLLALAGIQVAVFPLLVGGVASRMQLVTVASAYVCALAVAWALVANLRWLWQAAVLFVVVAGGLSYALHRYERVALGLVEAENR